MRFVRESLVCTLLAAALLPAVAGAQAEPAVVIHHGFPLAGGALVLVVDGLQPGEDVVLRLLDAIQAPISLIEEMSGAQSPPPQFEFRIDETDASVIQSVWRADTRGRVLLEVVLDDLRDVDKTVQLEVLAFGGAQLAALELRVQPPMLVLPSAQGLMRLSLLDGSLLLPAIPAEGGLRGMALSSDGLSAAVLRDGGLLQTLAARDWTGAPLSTRAFDPATDVLAGGPAGAAFLLARPGGLPFPDAASLLFPDEGALRLEPMAQAVGGRRVALSADGLTAFVAEDDLVVREIDLLAREPRALLSVGLPGDRAVADLLLDGRRLLVATRGAAGRGGSLTAFDLDHGLLTTLPLVIDPARLVALGEGRVVVVPAEDGWVELLRDGVPVKRILAPGDVLDAAPSAGGALLLTATPDGRRALTRLQPAGGGTLIVTTPQPLAAPGVTRLVATPAGMPGVVVLLGDPSGAVHIWRADRGLVETLPGLQALPDAAFALLP
jgi:hypothetical protein